MNRTQFIDKLAKKLSKLPKKELKETVDYYYEIIDDKVNEGMSEEDAINSLGSIDKIANSILPEETLRENKKQTNWKIVLLSSTAIIWIPVLISLLAVAFAIYVSLWAIVISLGASSLATLVGSLVSIYGFIDLFNGSIGSGLTYISMGIGSIGLSFVLYYVTILSGKLLVLLTKKIFARGEKNEK